MTHQEKIEMLRSLEDRGIVRENCPDEYFWRFDVIKPDELPEAFQAEYERLGEVRW